MTLDEIRKFLGSPDDTSITIGHVAAAGSANAAVAAKRAQELASNPLYFAKYGGKEHAISRDLYLQLRARGAKDKTPGHQA